jgi:hypothetical protein
MPVEFAIVVFDVSGVGVGVGVSIVLDVVLVKVALTSVEFPKVEFRL